MQNRKTPSAKHLLTQATHTSNKNKINLLTQALTCLTPTSPLNIHIEILLNLGDSYAPQKRMQGKYYLKAYKLIKKNNLQKLLSKACIRLGNCREKYKQHHHSVYWYHEALKYPCTRSDKAKAYFGLANVHGNFEENIKGLAYIKTALSFEPKNKKFHKTKQRLEHYIQLQSQKKQPIVHKESLFAKNLPTNEKEYTLFGKESNLALSGIIPT